MIKLTNKEKEFIELALDEKWQFGWVSLETKTLKKLYKTYNNYMKMALEKDDLEIKIGKSIELIKCSKDHVFEHDGSKIYLTRYSIDELLEILERGEINESN